jgi:two-component system, chemotaxis family, sensor kinase CheA
MKDQFRESFQEEARENLQELESALLMLNESSEDMELISRAFRALHTIKGSGSMFGFDDVAGFTHHVETAFDEVRNGRLPATPDLISLTLSAADQIKSMLDEAAGKGEADVAVSAKILADLKKLTGELDTGAAHKAHPAETHAPEAASGPVSDWIVRFSPHPEFMRTGSNPMLVIRDLAQLGSLRAKADTSHIPEFDELDPEQCFVSWEIELSTASSQLDIRNVFIFVEDDCDLVIEASPTSAETGDTADAAPRPGRGPTAGRRGAEATMQAANIRVPAAKLDTLVAVVGQLVTLQARLGEIAARSEDRDLQTVAEEVESLVSELRDNSMSMRTMPLKSTFERFTRLVFDLGRSLNKNVNLVFDGGETELDKSVIDQLNDPLMHLVRNSMDHGIEPPAERLAAGKPASANIQLSARHAGAQVLISVTDDGRGIDRELVRAKAIANGLIAPDARLSDSEVFALIMEPGFSTAREITDVSGRGVGMDVVKKNVEALRGSIEISSKPGQGSTVSLRLPLTLAIIDGLLVRVGEAKFVMPLANTVECVELTQRDIDSAHGNHLANIRGELIAYIRLSEYLQTGSSRPEIEQLMVTETEHGRFGIVVDQVLGDHQTVIKNLGRLYRNVQVISGATILGDGSVALILDLHRLVQSVIRNSSAEKREPALVPHPSAVA